MPFTQKHSTNKKTMLFFLWRLEFFYDDIIDYYMDNYMLAWDT